MKSIMVRRYALLEPLDWGADCERQLRLMAYLWNDLIEIERGHREDVLEIGKDDPAVMAAQAELAPLRAQRAALKQQRKTERSRARSKIPTPALDAEIERVAKAAKDATKRIKAARKTARENATERRATLKEELKAAVKRARQRSGLWWGNSNAVIASFWNARSKAIAEGAELQKHHIGWDARLVNQIQGGMSIEALFSAEHSQVSIERLSGDELAARLDKQRRPGYVPHHLKPGSSRERRERGILTATIYTTAEMRRTVRWPIIMERPLPEGHPIKEVVITRRALADAWRWKVSFLCVNEEAEPVAPATGPTVAINFGWRRVPQGLRVATILGEGEPSPSHVILPEDCIADARSIDKLKKRLDLEKNEMLVRLRSIEWEGAPAPLAVLWAAIRQAGERVSGRRLSELCEAWARHSAWEPAMAVELAQWNYHRRHLRHGLAHWSDQVLYRRRDCYRKAAAAIAARVGRIIIDQSDFRALATKEDNDLPQAARRYRVIGAPGELRRILQEAAAKRGVSVTVHEGPSTRKCHACGAPMASETPERLDQRCDECGVVCDQDENACRVMLAAASSSGPMTPEGPSPLERKEEAA